MTNHDKPSGDNGNKPMVLEMAPVDTRRIKTPSTLFSAPTEFLILAGRVTLSWSGVEQSMDRLIARMHIITEQDIPPGWEYLSFRQRKKRFRDLVGLVFHKNSFLTSYAHDGKRSANALRATIVSNWEESSGESRLIPTWPA